MVKRLTIHHLQEIEAGYREGPPPPRHTYTVIPTTDEQQRELSRIIRRIFHITEDEVPAIRNIKLVDNSGDAVWLERCQDKVQLECQSSDGNKDAGFLFTEEDWKLFVSDGNKLFREIRDTETTQDTACG